MRKEITDIRDAIIEQALFDAAQNGWSWHGIKDATLQCGYEQAMADSVFPQGLTDALDHLAYWADQHMLRRLEEEINPENLRIRDRIHKAVITRYAVLEPHKRAMRAALGYWSLPGHAGRAAKVLWRTADQIWRWAGDTSEDYNYYTKRGLLSGVITSTTLVWINDEDFTDSPEDSKTSKFLDARIENVLKIGKTFGQGMSKFKRLTGSKE